MALNFRGSKRRSPLLPVFTLALSLALGACSQEPAALPPPAAPQVDVWPVKTQAVQVEQTLSGRTVAYLVSDVRPQVGGIIQQRLFTEGQQVKAGEVLYQIDPASYQAAYDSARATLAQAEAAVLAAKPKAERYARLSRLDAVSQQDLDEAQATLRQNEAAVQAARAAVQTARIELDYTRIKAPIAGRIGTSTVTPGALVTASQEAALATIRQLDPLYVDVTQSSTQLLALQRQLASGTLQAVDGKVPVQLLLEDGSAYPHAGTLEVVGDAVDTGTGNVTLRAVVPNPDGMLLPGMYVRAQLPLALNQQAILVPQTAVTRNTKGEATVLLVGTDDKVEQRVIVLGDARADQWLVGSGLQAGERLIVAGGSAASAGATVQTQVVDKPVAQSAAASTAASTTSGAR
ncbi:efflux RND transporter periplasmic adaptor subunit [Corticibacter populi]|uniref:Efflux RND transporter periplasmic adaptor subunit n=1 Tax=Corticibacter populi TaxID=1550736 RepID=A0A3M6QXX5_9BURK|nr:efflux RND transporter periplasmic adaptor subunit [Corticibacter populi]RMX07723.1 efflux RND transporter periplasmic adaptor subunit [Corticibacter populi]RZS30239.1 multidrug efflux system membrane fusion protein [Corticibacter populi]